MSAHDELEPVPGLPAKLPAGERILWQGSPRWRALAWRTYALPWLALYFAVMVAARVIWGAEESAGDLGFAVLAMVAVFASCLGGLALLAWLQARATAYTITTHRVVMRIGASLSVTWNLPFARLASADLRTHEGSWLEGDGDIVFTLAPPDRIRWLFFFPHVEPGRFLDPRPALRCIEKPAHVAEILRGAVARHAARTATPIEILPRPSPTEVEHGTGSLVLEAGR